MRKIIRCSMINRNHLVGLICCFVMLSCQTKKVVENDVSKADRIAAVGEEVLYKKDIEKFIKNETGKDSILLRERFINNWIRKAVLLQKAKLNLSEEEQDVEKMVAEYKSSLLINQYKQKYLSEHLDTLVTEKEVKLYMQEFSYRFILKKPLYRYYLAKVLKKNKSDIRFIHKLFSQETVNLMEDFKLENSTVIQSNDVDWYSESEVLKAFPDNLLSQKTLRSLAKGKVLKLKDKQTVYLFRIVDMVKQGKMSPFEYVNKNIREIILHNRKIALAQELEYEIYEDAKKNKQFEVY